MVVHQEGHVDGIARTDVGIHQFINFQRFDAFRAIVKGLQAIIEKYNGGPVGVNSIAASVGEDSETIEEVYEPYLIMEGFIKRTARGRVATDRAYTHFGKTPVISAAQFSIFEASGEGE